MKYINIARKIDNIGNENIVEFLSRPKDLNCFCFLSYKKFGLKYIINIIIIIYTFNELYSVLLVNAIYYKYKI